MKLELTTELLHIIDWLANDLQPLDDLTPEQTNAVLWLTDRIVTKVERVLEVKENNFLEEHLEQWK